ncbi:MAG: hypothetical protein ACK58T_32145, partial [Phycisphaerae bacterium]
MTEPPNQPPTQPLSTSAAASEPNAAALPPSGRMSMEKRDLIPRVPQGVLRWVGRVGMLVYVPAIVVPIALALLIRRWWGTGRSGRC